MRGSLMDKSYIDVHHNPYEGQIHVWTRDKSGKLEYEVVSDADYLYLFVPDNTGKTEFVNMKRKPMKKLYFDNLRELHDYGKHYPNVHESDVPIEYKYILDNFINAPFDCPINIGFYDIEVDFDLNEGRGYPSIRDPFGAVNAISLFDLHKKKYVMLTLSALDDLDLKDADFPVETRQFLSEKELLRFFCDKVVKDIDILVAWNGDAFDLNYIMERLIVLFGEKDAVRMLCRDGQKAIKKEFTNEFGEEIWKWRLVGRNHADMMLLFKKFHPSSQESFSLNSICEKYLGMEKIDYDGDLGELYRENPHKFFEYSLHDTRLLVELDKSQQIMKLAIGMTRNACVFLHDALGAIKLIETDFIKFCRKKGNIVLPDKITHKKQSYDGAIVYDTIAGLHNWIFGVDLRSLYPFTMIMLGLSPETMVMQCSGGYEDYIHIMTKNDSYGEIEIEIIDTGEFAKIKPSELYEIIIESGMTISANGTIFDGSLGLLAEYAQEGFNLRAHYKKLKKEAEKIGDDLMAAVYDLYQLIAKIKINSIYGATGNEFFRLFDIRLAQSITLSAQIVSKQQAYSANYFLDELAA
jgi:DNA polymerase elongation subunit (family B)